MPAEREGCIERWQWLADVRLVRTCRDFVPDCAARWLHTRGDIGSESGRASGTGGGQGLHADTFTARLSIILTTGKGVEGDAHYARLFVTDIWRAETRGRQTCGKSISSRANCSMRCEIRVTMLVSDLG